MRQSIDYIIQYGSLLCILISLVYSAGIVWRVRQRLDVSYKFLTVAFLILALQLGIDTFVQGMSAQDRDTLRVFLQFFFCFFLLLGVWEMHTLVRDLDGEKKGRRRPNGTDRVNRQQRAATSKSTVRITRSK